MTDCVDDRLGQAKKTAHCRMSLVVTELFSIAVNYFDAKESARCKRDPA